MFRLKSDGWIIYKKKAYVKLLILKVLHETMPNHFTCLATNPENTAKNKMISHNMPI